jgi:hypothetical protein
VRAVGWLLLLYGAASLLHFAHNAILADAYPGLPAVLTPAVVMGAWTAEALIGVAGWTALRRGRVTVGLAAIALYGALGFDGLAHYLLAPASAHTVAMNLTIALETAAAAALLAAVARRLLTPPPPRARAAAS